MYTDYEYDEFTSCDGADYALDAAIPPMCWDTRQVKDMRGIFANQSTFNSEINSWQTSAVTDMSGMFSNKKRVQPAVELVAGGRGHGL